MRRPLAALLLLTTLGGCKADSPSRHPDGGVDSGGLDGAADDVIQVSLCRLTDLRGFCTAWDGTELALRLGGGSPTTVAGDFSVPRPAGSEVVLLTLDDPAGGYFAGAVRLDAVVPSPLSMRLILNADLDDVLSASGAILPPGSGVTVLHFLDPGGAPAPGITLATASDGAEPWYASDMPGVFVPDGATDESGVAAYFDLADGDFSAAIVATDTTVNAYAVADALVNMIVEL